MDKDALWPEGLRGREGQAEEPGRSILRNLIKELLRKLPRESVNNLE